MQTSEEMNKKAKKAAETNPESTNATKKAADKPKTPPVANNQATEDAAQKTVDATKKATDAAKTTADAAKKAAATNPQSNDATKKAAKKPKTSVPLPQIAYLPKMTSPKHKKKNLTPEELKAETEAKQKKAKEDYNLGVNLYKGQNGQVIDKYRALQLIQSAADSGYAPAQDYIGNCYLNGLNNYIRHIPSAISWYEKAANQNYKKAQLHLADCYRYGKGIPRNPEKALELYRKASVDAPNNCLQAIVELGHCYREGIGVPKDAKEAFQHYQTAMAKGSVEAQAWLGSCHVVGEGVKENVIMGYSLLVEATQKGNKTASNQLKHFYTHGTGIPKEEAKAIAFFQALANQGCLHAQREMAGRYLNGAGVPKNAKLAVEYYTQLINDPQMASHSEVAKILIILVDCYEKGIGVLRDMRKALALAYLHAQITFKREACLEPLLTRFSALNPQQKEVEDILFDGLLSYQEKNNYEKSNKLIVIDREHYLIPKIRNAISYFERAALLGCAEAQYFMGICNANGVQFGELSIQDPNNNMAKEWYGQAANKGQADALFNLALLAEDSIGVSGDIPARIKEIHQYYEAAAKNGHEDACHNLAVCLEKGEGGFHQTPRVSALYQQARYAAYNFGIYENTHEGFFTEEVTKNNKTLARRLGLFDPDHYQAFYYEHIGPDQSPMNAYHCLKRSVARGNLQAERRLNQLASIVPLQRTILMGFNHWQLSDLASRGPGTIVTEYAFEETPETLRKRPAKKTIKLY